jgi:hypothetical protein
VVVRANADGGAYALAVDDDGWLCRFAWLYRFCVGVLDYCLDFAEDATLYGSGTLLLRVPPTVLDLD